MIYSGTLESWQVEKERSEMTIMSRSLHNQTGKHKLANLLALRGASKFKWNSLQSFLTSLSARGTSLYVSGKQGSVHLSLVIPLVTIL